MVSGHVLGYCTWQRKHVFAALCHSRCSPHPLLGPGPGCVVGALDLYLHRPRASDAVAISPGGVRLLRLSSAKLAGLAAEAPQVR